MSYIAMMHLKKNILKPAHSDWRTAYCSVCGQECWQCWPQEKNAELFTRIFADTQFLCTECALLRSAQNGSGHAE